jgi:glycosyltransferase involved in cell wall biosynthesis
MTGFVDPDEVPDLLRGMDVAVAPYPALKGFYFSPLKVTEYLAAGLPTVASRVGPLPELLDLGRAGVLVPPGDPVALAAAIRALRADPARRTELARTGRLRAISQYEWSSVVSRALALVDLRHDHDHCHDHDREPEVAHGLA